MIEFDSALCWEAMLSRSKVVLTLDEEELVGMTFFGSVRYDELSHLYFLFC